MAIAGFLLVMAATSAVAAPPSAGAGCSGFDPLIDAGSARRMLSVAGQARILENAGPGLTFPAIRAMARTDSRPGAASETGVPAFRAHCGAVLTPHRAGRVDWLHLSFRNGTDAEIERVLVFSDPAIDRVTLYQPSANEKTYSESAGRGVPLFDRYVRSREPEFHLNFEAGETRELFFRIDAGGATAIDMQFGAARDHDSNELIALVIFALITGFIVAGCVYGLVLYAECRSVGLLYFVAYLVTYQACNGVFEGLLNKFSAVPVSPYQQDVLIEGLALLAAALYVQMTRLVLQLPVRSPAADRVFVGMIVGFIVLLGLNFIDPRGFAAVNYLFLIAASVVFLVIAVKLFREGDRVALYCILGQVCFYPFMFADAWLLYFPPALTLSPTIGESALHILHVWGLYLGGILKTVLVAISWFYFVRNFRAQAAAEQIAQAAVDGADVLSADAEFVGRVRTFVQDRLRDADLNVTALAREMAVSESSLRRRLQIAGGVTPGDLIRNERLRAAHRLIGGGAVQTAVEAAREVGFVNAGYFSRLYKEKYGQTPFEHLRNPAAGDPAPEGPEEAAS